MGSVLGKNDAISGVIAGWTVPFSTDFVAHLNGGSGFNSTVGIMTDFALLKISIDQNIKEGETYEIGATASEDQKVRLEFDDTRSGEQGTYLATSGKFTVLYLQGRVLKASFHFKAKTAALHHALEMDFTSGSFIVEDFKHD